MAFRSQIKLKIDSGLSAVTRGFVLLMDMLAPSPYSDVMTKLLEEAIAAVRRLPDETQDELGRFLLALADESPLTPDEMAAIEEAEAEIERGEGVSGERLRAFWRSMLHDY